MQEATPEIFFEGELPELASEPKVVAVTTCPFDQGVVFVNDEDLPGQMTTIKSLGHCT